MAVMEDDHNALAVRQLLHEVADPGVAGGRGGARRRQDAIEHPPATVDPIAAGHADALEPPLDGGRVPKLTEGLTTEDIGVLDGVFGGLRTEERPSERKEAWPEAFEREVEPIAVQPSRIGAHGPVVSRDAVPPGSPRAATDRPSLSRRDPVDGARQAERSRQPSRHHVQLSSSVLAKAGHEAIEPLLEGQPPPRPRPRVRGSWVAHEQ